MESQNLFGDSANGDGDPQKSLFDRGEWWENEWQGMPEFKHEDLTAFKAIVVHFANREDMESFAQLVGQKLTMDTRFIWFPKQEIIRYGRAV